METSYIQIILVFECSRLSRMALDFLSIIEQLNDNGVSIFFYHNGLETLLPDGNVNLIAALVFGIMSQFNSMERDLIKARMANGYKHFSEDEGGKVGRKVGYRKTNYQDEYGKEISLLKKNVSRFSLQIISFDRFCRNHVLSLLRFYEISDLMANQID